MQFNFYPYHCLLPQNAYFQNWDKERKDCLVTYHHLIKSLKNIYWENTIHKVWYWLWWRGQGNRVFPLKSIIWQPNQRIYLLNYQFIHFTTICWDMITHFEDFLKVLVDCFLLYHCFKAYLVSASVPIFCNKNLKAC